MRFARLTAALAAAFLLVPQGAAFAAPDADSEGMKQILSEDFEGYEVGEAPNKDWNVVLTENCTALTEERTDGHGKVMVLNDDVKEGIHCKLIRKIPKQSGIVTLQFDYMDSNENSVAYMYVKGNDVTVTGIQIAPTAIDGARGFHSFRYTYTDKKGEAHGRGVMRLNGGVWYRMTFVMDTTRGKWSYFINGIEVVADEAFNSKTSVIDEFGFYTSSWQENRSYIDNIRMFTGTPDTEELGIQVKKRNDGISYGEYLIAEPGSRGAGEELTDWQPWYTLGGDVLTAEDEGETVIKMSNTKIKKEFPTQRKAVKMSLDFKDSSAAGNGEFLIRNDIAPIVQILTKKRDGKAYLTNMNANGTYTEYAEIEIGKWHHLEIDLDLEKSIYDVYLDGERVISGMETREFTNAVNLAAFYTGGTTDKYWLSLKNIIVTEKDVSEVRGEKRRPNTYESNVPKLEGKPTYDNFKGATYPYGKYKNKSTGKHDLKAIEEDLKLMRDAGIHWLRLGINYGEDFDEKEQILDLMNSYGISVVMSIAKINPGNRIGTAEQEAENAEGYKRIIERFGSKVHDWEVGNEPNLGGFWNQSPVEEGGTGDRVHDYVVHLKNVYTALKSVDPDCNVIIGGLSEWVAEWFVDEIGKYEAYKYFDEFCLHPYADTPDDVIGRIRSVKQHIAQWPEPYNYFPMWITEVGFHTEQVWTVPSTVPDEIIKANYVQGTFEKIYEEMGQDVRPICWYSYMEESSANGYGLVAVSYSDGTRNCTELPALAAIGAVDDVTPREKFPTVYQKPANAADTENGGGTPAAEPEEKLEAVSIKAGDETLEQKGYIRGNTVFVPLRATLEAAGAAVLWNDAAQSVETVAKSGTRMLCGTAAAAAWLDGVYVRTDAPAELSGDIMMIPLRLAEKAAGVTIKYSETSRTAEIVVGKK